MTTLDPAILAEIEKGSLRVETMLKLDFPGGAITTTTSPKAISYGGDTYKPNALLQSVSGISERADGKAGLLTLKLNPTDELRALIAADDWQGSEVYPYFAFLDGNYGLIDACLMSVYLMSTANYAIDTGTATLDLECEPFIVKLEQHNPVWPSTQDQALRSPGDTFFNGAATIKGQRFQWGGRTYVRGGSGGRFHLPLERGFGPSFERK